MNLKASIMEVTGFIKRICCDFGETIESGYTTGLAYIISCTPNPTRKVKSLYLVVKEEIRIPKLKPKPDIIAIRKGRNTK
jgi:hypothetical protein